MNAAQRSSEFAELREELSAWQIPPSALDNVHDAARASLNEVKALMEYEDEKISRLLTIITFLSALVGAAYTRFAGDYVWPALSTLSGTAKWWLPFSTYVAFFLYIVLVTGAVIALMSAIRPRLDLPGSWSGGAKPGAPTSMLFYKGILAVSAHQWARTFVQQADHEGKALKASYAKCYIGEAYLVAEKVADKLRSASKGGAALSAAMVLLLVFFILFALTTLYVPATKGPASVRTAATESTR